MRSIAVFLLAWTFLSGCGKHGVTGVSVDKDFEKLIAPTAKVLAGVELDKLKESAFYQRHQELMKIPLLDGMAERVGLDPRRDIARVLVAWDGRAYLAMLEGRFSKEKAAKAFGENVSRSTFKGYQLFGAGQDTVALLKDGLGIAGPTDQVKAALVERENDTGEAPDALKAKLASLSSSDQVWLASRGGLPFMEFSLRSDYASALSNIVNYISTTNVGLTVDQGLHLESEITCVSPEGVKRVRDALRGSIGLARLTTNDNQLDMLRLWDSIHVSEDGQNVRVRAELPADLSDKMLTLVMERAGGLQKR